MFSLTIVFGPAGTAWTLMFKTEEPAAKLARALVDPARGGMSDLVGDDFGQRVSVVFSEVHAVMLENMSESAEARIERGLDQARSQAKAQEKAMADPALMASMRRTQQGPAVLQPGGMPRMM